MKRLLIANRGEIACRIVKTCNKMGIKTVAVYSDIDKESLHVKLADEAVRIGPNQAADSYLRIDRLLEAAKATGADAIHPGYGFLSENPAFARACRDVGINFVGPTVEAMELMGHKSKAKEIMARAGVPVIPGYNGGSQDVAAFLEAARKIGYPLMVKAAMGGGGKGIRTVFSETELASSLEQAMHEAQASFSDSHCLLEKLLVQTRHIEVQVFGDSHGNVVHLFERDCSTQRRNQKLLEESPAPGLSDTLRRQIHQSAVTAAKAVGYKSAGTVEFLLEPGTGSFYFLEMNTRLQVEHPVTEMVTGLDLVQWQLEVAMGNKLPRSQDEITINGCAMEARISAEKTTKFGHQPSVGILDTLELPESSVHVRVDTGVREHDEISPFYDATIAKIIVSAADRESTRLLLDSALQSTRITGVANNVIFLRSILADSRYSSGTMTTDYVGASQERLIDWCDHYKYEASVVAAAVAFARSIFPLDSTSLWGTTISNPLSVNITCGGTGFHVTYDEIGRMRVSNPEGKVFFVSGFNPQHMSSPQSISINGAAHVVAACWAPSVGGKVLDVSVGGHHYLVPIEVQYKTLAALPRIEAVPDARIQVHQ